MKKWMLLGGAIVAEVSGPMALRAAVDQPGWIPAVVVSYALAFTLLGLTLRAGMKIGAAYGIWAATGVALVATLGMAIFGETLSNTALVGIGVIIIGVVLIETGVPHGPAANEEVTA